MTKYRRRIKGQQMKGRIKVGHLDISYAKGLAS